MRKTVEPFLRLLGGLIFWLCFGVTGQPAFANTAADCTSSFATGGNVSVVTLSGVPYCVHAFTATGASNFTPLRNLSIDALIVAGGGGGAGYPPYNSAGGGGGGAGGLIFETNVFVSKNVSLPLSVGAGGDGASQTGVQADDGGDTTFNGLTAIGGGGAILTGGNDNTPARDGGSGGGGRQNPPGAALQPSSPDGGFGNDGARNSTDNGGGGGGGAGTEPADITSDDGGDGGDGLDYSAFFGTGYGDNGRFAGGGGGGGDASGARGLGGTGGGGDGASDRDGISPTPGQPNTGGGGGGGSSDHIGATGGSGVVLVRYVANRPPASDAGTDFNAFANTTVTLDGTSSSDPDGNLDAYQWAQTGGPAVSLNGSASAQPDFQAPQPSGGPTQTFTFELTVTDDLGETSVDTVTVTVDGVADIAVDKSLSVFSEDGAQCADTNIPAPPTPPELPAIPGACVAYVLTVTNTGAGAAQSVEVTDTLNASTSFVAASLGAGWGSGTQILTPPVGCSGAGCDVVVQNGALPAGQSGTVLIRAFIQ